MADLVALASTEFAARYNASAWTAGARVLLPNVGVTGAANQTLFGVSDGTAANFIGVVAKADGKAYIAVTVSSSTTYSSTGVTLSNSAAQQLVLTKSASGVLSLYVNGTVGPTLSTTLPSGMTAFPIGAQSDGTLAQYGYTQAVDLVPYLAGSALAASVVGAPLP